MQFIKKYLSIITLIFLMTTPVFAQQVVQTLDIFDVDASAFPVVAVSFVARDAEGVGIDAFNGLQLSENDLPVEDVNLISTPVGVDVTYIIDANATIAGIDLVGDVSRLEKVKTAISNHAQQYVSRAGLDRVSIIAPVGGEANWLFQNEADPEQIVQQIASYAPTEFATASPVDAMLRLAFQQAAEREPTNRYQAIVLMSDAEFLRDQVDFFAVRDIAVQSDAVFFGMVLGKVASQSEIDNMGELYIPTGGSWLHMPQPENADPIFRTIKSNSDTRLLRYRSNVAIDGEQRVQLVIDGTVRDASYTVDIEPPQVEWLLSNEPVVRTGAAETPVDQLEPIRKVVETQLVWPDGFPRELTQVRFFVNDIEQRIDPPPVLDGNGVLTFDWNIANLAADIYRLEIELADELGATARSSPFLQRIDYDSAESAPPIVSEPVTTTEQVLVEPTAVPEPSRFDAIAEQVSPYLTERNILFGMGGLIALLGIVFFVRWQQRGDKAFSADEPTAGSVVLPENVYIELMGARDSIASRIPVQAQSVAIGSDPFRADIVLDDDSVSRLHARLAYENGGYVLYDEGSAFGTRVNFEPIGLTPRPIMDTDELTFGSVRTRFRIYGARENGRTVRETDEETIEQRRFSLVPAEAKSIKAVIFDLDGTLIDSESVAMVAWAATVAQFGAEMDDRHQKLIIGVRLEEALDNVIAYFELPISAETLFDKLADEWRTATEGGLPPMPGVMELLDALDERSIPWGVATNSEADYATYHLKAIGLLERAGAIVGSDAVSNPKPAPDVFLECARLLQVDPVYCLAVEDTGVGHIAAANADMTVIAVPNQFADATEFTRADRIYANLSELLAELDTVLEGNV